MHAGFPLWEGTAGPLASESPPTFHLNQPHPEHSIFNNFKRSTAPKMGAWLPADDATRALIAQLQSQDSEAVLETLHAAGHDNGKEFADSQRLALQLMQEDLEHNAAFRNDRNMAASINFAVQADAHAIEEAADQELQELNDRREAHRLGGLAPPPLAIEAAPAVDDRTIDVLVRVPLYTACS